MDGVDRRWVCHATVVSLTIHHDQSASVGIVHVRAGYKLVRLSAHLFVGNRCIQILPVDVGLVRDVADTLGAAVKKTGGCRLGVIP